MDSENCGLKGLEIGKSRIAQPYQTHDNINELEMTLSPWSGKRFSHITYLATDEFLEENPFLSPKISTNSEKIWWFQAPAHNVAVDLFEEDTEEGIELDRIFSKSIETPLPFVSNRGFIFSPRRIGGVEKGSRLRDPFTFVFNVVDILFEILALEKEQEPYKDAINYFNKILDALLTLENFRKP